MSYGGAFAMNKITEIVVLVEGQTEKIFVEELLCSYKVCKLIMRRVQDAK